MSANNSDAGTSAGDRATPLDILHSYVNPPHSSAHQGIDAVARDYDGLSKDRAADLLSNATSYTLHREYHKPRATNPFYIYYRRQQMQIDLIDMRQLAAANDGFCWLVVAVDCFSRYMWARATYTKSGKDVCGAVASIIDAAGQRPESIFCDRGHEFDNRRLKAYLAGNGIRLLFPFSESKAALVERANKTLQGILYRDLTARNSKRYLDRMAAIVRTYNDHFHRTIKMSPREAELPAKADAVVAALRKHYDSREKYRRRKLKIKVGDVVRFKTNYGRRFARGYQEQFSREQCTVDAINTRMAIPMFVLRGSNGQLIQGAFYQEELQPYKTGEFSNSQVEKVMEREGGYIRVRWLGLDPGLDSWIIDDGSRVPLGTPISPPP